MDKDIPQGQWSSQWGFILAAAGAAVGLGNIWKFPYIAGMNGGGAFVFIYLLCILLIGVPLLMAEIMLGRAGQKNPYHTMKKLAVASNRSPHWGLVGGMNILASFLVLSFYSVIAGWALDYVFQTAMGHFYLSTESVVNGRFETLMASPYQLGFWHTVIMASTVAVVAMGVEKGLERSVCFMFPTMLALLLVVMGYSMSTGYFAHGIEFLFKPDFNEITAKGILSAVGHAFFTLSLAVGSIMMYGAYLPRHVSVLKTSLFIVAADTLIALVAGLAIFPIVFAHGLEPGAGPGLIFKSLPLAFGHMPYGTFFGTVFFVMLVFAAFTSAISMLEPSVAWCIETFKMSRVKSTFMMGGAIWLFGFLSVFSFNILKDVHIKIPFMIDGVVYSNGVSIFDFLDQLVSNYMLPLGGLFIAIFAAYRFKRARRELAIINTGLFRLWFYCLGIITPIAIIIVFLNAIGLFDDLKVFFLG